MNEQEQECIHKYIHVETVRKHENEGYFDYYEKVDRFFCEKCLDFQNIKQFDWLKEKPEWY